MKTVLLTGAFGNIGQSTLQKLLAAGHKVVCFDKPSPATEQEAEQYADRVSVVWGDIGDQSVLDGALEGVDAAVHLAGIIPPLSETNKELAQRVNVGGTNCLITSMQRSDTAKRLIFASTFGVFGRVQDRQPPLTNDTPVSPDDNYGQTKVDAEQAVANSGLDWTVLRICAAPPVKSAPGAAHDASTLFEMSADARIEFVHPDDVSTAFCNAVTCEGAIAKTFFLGGGKDCQVKGLAFAEAMMAGHGIRGSLPKEAFNPSEMPEFYGDWVDTKECQRLLRFQNHSVQDFIRDSQAAAGWKYYLVKLISPLAKRGMLKQSAYYSKKPQA